MQLPLEGRYNVKSQCRPNSGRRITVAFTAFLLEFKKEKLRRVSSKASEILSGSAHVFTKKMNSQFHQSFLVSRNIMQYAHYLQLKY